MKRLLFFFLVCIGLNAFAQVELVDSSGNSFTQEEVKSDVIKTFDGKVLKGKIEKLSLTDVFYYKTGEEKLSSVQRRLVNTIQYADGRIEVINESLQIKQEIKDYRKIKIVKKKREIANMIEVGSLEAKREGGKTGEFVTVKELERNALIELRKRAALLNADYVYYYNRKVTMGYGDIPEVIVYGKAYKEK